MPRNLVPRTDGQGSIGRSDKMWDTSYFRDIIVPTGGLTTTIAEIVAARLGKTDLSTKITEMVNTASDLDTRLTASEVTLESLQVTQLTGLIGFNTAAAMNADLSHAANTVAFVSSDSLSDNNGYYIKVGESGTGSWQKSAYTLPINDDSITTKKYADRSVTIEKLNSFDGYMMPKTLAQNTGEYTTPSTGFTSSIKGWALPFLKSKFASFITRISVYLSVPTASTITLGIANTIGTPLLTSQKTLSASGKIDFDIKLDISVLNNTFYIYFISDNALKFSKATQGDYPSLADGQFFYYANGSWVAASVFSIYGIADIKIYTDYDWAMAKLIHTHTLSQITDYTDAVDILLPSSYDLVAGDTFELFWKGILFAADPYKYFIKAVSAAGKGAVYKRKYAYTPVVADVGTQTLALNIYNDNNTLLNTKTITMTVRNKASSPSTQKNILCFGDSLTVGGYWVNELYRRLTGTGGTPSGDGLANINFIGNKKTTLGAGFEGAGGWKYSNYTTNTASQNIYWITCTHDKTAADQHSLYKDSSNVTWSLETIESGQIKVIATSAYQTTPPAGSTLTWYSGGDNHSTITFTATEGESGNPFWNETTSAVDFTNYATEQGVSSIDIAYILLGWNQSADTETDFKASVRALLDPMIASFPNIKIVLMGLQVPSLDSLTVVWSYYGYLQFAFNCNKWYMDLAAEYPSNVKYLNIAGQFDSEYNYPYDSYAVNARSATTERRNNNSIHPSLDGYMQIADAVYRHITGLL